MFILEFSTEQQDRIVWLLTDKNNLFTPSKDLVFYGGEDDGI